MINIIKLLTDSFESYKKNFRNIILMSLPIFILSSMGAYYSITVNSMIKNGNIDIYYIIVGMIMYLVAMIAVGLFFVPALNRAVQKHEDDKDFDIKEGYNFQKNNMWRWIKVNIWGVLYMLYRLLPYIIILVLTIGSIALYNATEKINPIIAGIGAAIALMIFFIGVILNVTRFVVYKNIFFSKKHMTTRNIVRESMELGKTKNLEIWKLILTLFIFGLMVTIVMFVTAFASSLIIQIFESKNFSIIDIIISPLISAFLVIPISLIISAKGYNKIRGHVHEVHEIEAAS